MAEDSVASDVVVKETLYQTYLRFCNKHKLAILSKEILGKNLKKKYEEGRETSGKRPTVWKGIKLTEEYTDIKQETLDVSEVTNRIFLAIIVPTKRMSPKNTNVTLF